MFNFRNIFTSCCNVTQNRDIEVDLTSNTYPDDRHEHYTKSPHNDGKITPDDIAHGPQLKMTVVESTLLSLNTEFRINPGGLAIGGRSKNDGETYIGLKSEKGDKMKVNDIWLEDSSVGGQHCMIKYDPIKRSYFLHDLGEGSGTFIKIEKELEMKSGYIISFSDSHMLVHTRDVEGMSGVDDEQAPQQDDKKGNITIKFLDGPKVDEVFKFKAEDKTIKIGRMADCQIKFDDNNLSRYQCTFKYFNNAWYIMDGFRAKSSTNGTWLLVDNKVELFHDTTIKIGQTLFKVDIQEGNQG